MDFSIAWVGCVEILVLFALAVAETLVTEVFDGCFDL